MRPYAIKKDDPKCNIGTYTTSIQPSPLALLAATCSRIGDTLHSAPSPVFTQKNLIASTQHHHPIEKRLQENEHSHQHFSFDNNNIHSTITTTSTTTIHQQLLNPLLSTTDTRTSSNIGADCLLHNRSQPPTETLTLPTNNQLPIFSTHQQTQQASISPSCLKVKTEHTNLPSPASSISSGSGYNINNNNNNNNSNTTLDLNQNYTESMHICPNIINETRMLESQPRASYTRVCSHETAPHSSNCEHQMGSPNQHNTLTRQNTLLHTPHHHHQQQMQQHQHQSSCQQDNIGTLSHMPTSPSSSGSSSCLYQGGTQQHQQISPSCGMTTLSHFSMSTANNSAINNNNNNNNNMICDNSSFASRSTATKSTPSINPWQNQTVNRLGQEQQPNQHKSQCMIHDNNNYTTAQQQQQQQQTTELTLQQHHSHVMPPSPQERAFRTYSPPEQQDRQFASSSFRSPEYGPPSVESHHSAQHYSTLQSPHQTQQQQQQQQQTFDGYGTPTSFDNGMDIKPDPYTLQTMRNASSMISPTSYDTHSHSMNTPPDSMNPPPALQSAHYMSHHSHHPSLNYGGSPVTGYPSNFPMHQSPELVPGAPMNTHPDMIHQQNYVDYQYQQQMFYSRENRRPRRIACTCPNCRDGENKTVTTKDGKQRKLHICHILGCGKEYGKTSHLRAHLRWHAGERPFACNWLFCNKRFTRSDELQRHRRTHTGDKRFECSVCLKKFMRSDHLSKHMKTHQSQQNKQNKEKVGVSGTIDNTNIDKHNNNNNNNNNKVSKVSLMGKQQSDLEKSKFMNSLGLPNSLNLQ